MLCQVFLLPNYYYFSAMLDYDHKTTLFSQIENRLSNVLYSRQGEKRCGGCQVEEIVPLLPLLVLCTGLSLLVVSKRLAGGAYSAHISLSSALLGLASAVYLIYAARSDSLEIRFDNWAPVPEYAGSLFYRVDSWSALFAVLALATILAALLLRTRLSLVFPGRGTWADVLLLALGVVFINLVSANSAMPLVGSWILLGLVAYAGAVASSERAEARIGAQSALVMSCVSGSLLLLVMIVLGRVTGDGAAFSAASHGQVSLPIFVLLLLALATYAGLFPLNLWVTELGGLPSSFAATSGILTGLASIYLLGRFYPIIDGDVAPTFTIILIAVGCASVAYGAISSWVEPDFLRLLRHLATIELGYAFIAIGLGVPAALGAATLIAANLALSGGAVALYVLELRSRGIGGEDSLASRSPVELILALLACASLIGSPPLIGFFARWMLYNAAIETGYGVVVLIGVVVSAVSIVPFLKSADHLLFSRSDLGWQHPKLHSLLSLSAVGVLQLPSLAMGLLPWMSLQHVVGPAVASALAAGAGPISLAMPGSIAVPDSVAALSSLTLAGDADHVGRLVALAAALAVAAPFGIAAKLYPFPLGRARLDFSHLRIASPPSATRDSLGGIRVALEIAALSLFRTFSPQHWISAFGGALEWLGTVLHNSTVRVEERYYFPALLLLGIALVFVFLS